MDPEFALFHLQRALWDPVDPTRVGSLAPELRARVNGEYYRFSRTETMMRFVTDPVRFCGVLRDPVTGARFWPSHHSPRCDWDNAPYFFSSDSTRAEFLKDPKKYQVLRWS